MAYSLISPLAERRVDRLIRLARLVESGDEVVVTYEAARSDGSRFRNTEVLTFGGDRICRAEVYLGWNL